MNPINPVVKCCEILKKIHKSGVNRSLVHHPYDPYDLHGRKGLEVRIVGQK